MYFVVMIGSVDDGLRPALARGATVFYWNVTPLVVPFAVRRVRHSMQHRRDRCHERCEHCK
jgi:hypothetical protein